MSDDVSTFRLYLLRFTYLMNFVGLGFIVWPQLINHPKPWDPLHGVAFSFWAALSVLMGLGLRYPLQMLPLLLLQLFYKLIWLTAVAFPLWQAGRPSAMTTNFVIPVVIDLIVIPWPYVFAHYFKKRGERWTLPKIAAPRPSNSP